MCMLAELYFGLICFLVQLSCVIFVELLSMLYLPPDTQQQQPPTATFKREYLRVLENVFLVIP